LLSYKIILKVLAFKTNDVAVCEGIRKNLVDARMIRALRSGDLSLAEVMTEQQERRTTTALRKYCRNYFQNTEGS